MWTQPHTLARGSRNASLLEWSHFLEQYPAAENHWAESDSRGIQLASCHCPALCYNQSRAVAADLEKQTPVIGPGCPPLHTGPITQQQPPPVPLVVVAIYGNAKQQILKQKNLRPMSKQSLRSLNTELLITKETENKRWLWPWQITSWLHKSTNYYEPLQISNIYQHDGLALLSQSTNCLSLTVVWQGL